MNAMQWHHAFDKALTQLSDCGLPKSEREVFLDYINKCGPALSKLVQTDKRSRLDRENNDGSYIHRAPETWKEAHEPVKEKEPDGTAQKVLHHGYAGNPNCDKQPKTKNGCAEAADWLVADLKSFGAKAEKYETGGHPIVLGDLGSDSGPHILFYGHYDVQPVDPLELWDNDPFEPVSYTHLTLPTNREV